MEEQCDAGESWTTKAKGKVRAPMPVYNILQETEYYAELGNTIDKYMGGRVMHIAPILWEETLLGLFRYFTHDLLMNSSWLLGKAGKTYVYLVANGYNTQEHL